MSIAGRKECQKEQWRQNILRAAKIIFSPRKIMTFINCSSERVTFATLGKREALLIRREGEASPQDERTPRPTILPPDA